VPCRADVRSLPSRSFLYSVGGRRNPIGRHAPKARALTEDPGEGRGDANRVGTVAAQMRKPSILG
jgi:hypothetical protein